MKAITQEDLEWAFSEVVAELEASEAKINLLRHHIETLQMSLQLKQQALAEMGAKVNILTGEAASREAEKISDSSQSPIPPDPADASVSAEP